jgi:subtilisin family serine protease
MRAFTLLLNLLTAGQLLAAEPRYGVAVVDAAALWSVTKRSGVKVGVIDTGIDFDHPALRAAYRGGYDFAHNDRRRKRTAHSWPGWSCR